MAGNTILASSEKILKHGRKIVAIGRNYIEHAKELGNPVPSKPFFFLKPTTSYIRSGKQIELPGGASANVHHEIELGVVIGSNANANANNKAAQQSCKNVSEEEAMEYVQGYILALDLTERTLQNDAKKAGKPWTISKGYDTFCPISDSMLIMTSSASTITSSLPLDPATRLWCKVNGQVRQDGPIGDMIFSIPKLISFVSSIMTLEENDVILTGTPAGVGPIVPGDVIEGGLAFAAEEGDKLTLKFDVVASNC